MDGVTQDCVCECGEIVQAWMDECTACHRDRRVAEDVTEALVAGLSRDLYAEGAPPLRLAVDCVE